MPDTSIGRGAAWAMLLAGLAIARVLAQTPSPQPNGSLSGRVLDGSTGQPVIGAQVMLDPTGSVSSRGGSTRSGRTVTTNAQGAFTFGETVPGSRRIEATKAGYRTGYAGGLTAITGVSESLQLSAGERRTGVIVRMWRSAVIAGKIKLASGSPLVGITVTAAQVTNSCGVDHLFGIATTTDDTGAYRFFDLAPGDYVIGITSIRGATMASGAYHTTSYPGVVDPAAARSVSLRGGDEQVGVDLVVPSTGFSINGRFVLSDGSAVGGKRSVDLWSASPNPVVDRPMARVFTDLEGRFQFQNMPAGRYVARVVEFPPQPNGGIRQSMNGFSWASSNRLAPLPPMTDDVTWWGETPVEVTDRDVDTTVHLQEGWRIQGRVTFDAANPPPVAARESMPVLTNRSDGSAIASFGATFQSGRVESDGRFTTIGLPPGRYLLSVLLAIPSSTAAPTNLSLQAIRVGGRDVTGSAIELNNGNVSDVTVTFTDRGPAIAGTVEGGENLVTFGSRVYLFPTDERYWADCGTGWPRLRSIPVGTDGRFQNTGIPPGDYFVAAAIGGEDSWTTAEFLRSLVPFATRVKLELGDKASIQVKARPRR